MRERKDGFGLAAFLLLSGVLARLQARGVIPPEGKHPPSTAGARILLAAYGSSGCLQARHLPVPWQQFRKPRLRDVGDAGEHVGEPGERIDIIELGRHDQRRSTSP